MNSESGGKINQLLKAWPRGTVGVLPWLRKQGVYQQLADQYVRSGWLRRLGRGAYVRAGDEVDWPGALYALQQLGLQVHVGAQTALELQGRAHFLPAGRGNRVVLFGQPGVRLPAWFREHEWGVPIVYFTAKLFEPDEELNVTEHGFGGWGSGGYGRSGYGTPLYTIRLSAAERAMLEVCSRVPQTSSYEEAFHLMENLASLRPHRLQVLLERCTSVKTKRLFLHLAERCGHAWVGKLELAKVNLGKGKRMLVRGGKLDPKYHITVPTEDS